MLEKRGAAVGNIHLQVGKRWGRVSVGVDRDGGADVGVGVGGVVDAGVDAGAAHSHSKSSLANSSP